MTSLWKEITFAHFPSFPISAVLLLGIIAYVVFAYSHFSVPSDARTRTILGCLRGSLLLILLLIAFDPFWKKPNISDWMGVLIDDSASMSVMDPKAAPSLRISPLQQYFKDKRFEDFVKRYRPKFYRFSQSLVPMASLKECKADGKASRLLNALEEIKREFGKNRDLLGWIVFSDGNATDYVPDKMRMTEDYPIPLITVGLGEKGSIPNLRMEAPMIRDQVFAGEIVPLKIQWTSEGALQGTTVLEVRMNDEVILEKTVSVNAGEDQTEIPFKHEGEYVLTARLKMLQTEGSQTDNEVRFWVRVVPRQIKVYYSEAFYREENYFRKALEDDADFKVSFASSLVGFAREKNVPFIQDPLFGFPRTREELLQYDVIVLSDVKRRLLSEAQMNWIKELVEKGGGALVMVGGMDSFGDGGYVKTPIETMLPVEISEEYKKDHYLAARGTNDHPFRPLVAKSAGNHPLLQLDPDPETNEGLWKTMPLLGGYNYVGRLKPGASALLEHPADVSSFGPRVIMAVQSYGKGKVLAFTSDVTPNWGELFQKWKTPQGGWVYGHFWRNALKWLTENRMKEKTEPLQAVWKPQLPEELIPMKVILRLPFAENFSGARFLRLEVKKKNQSVFSREFKGGTVQPSMECELPELPEGDYRLNIFFSENGNPPLQLERPFSIHPSRTESRHLEAQPETLQKLAENSRGHFISISGINSFEEAVEKLEKAHSRRFSKSFWDQPWVYGLLIGLLFADWYWRKRKGLE